MISSKEIYFLNDYGIKKRIMNNDYDVINNYNSSVVERIKFVDINTSSEIVIRDNYSNTNNSSKSFKKHRIVCEFCNDYFESINSYNRHKHSFKCLNSMSAYGKYILCIYCMQKHKSIDMENHLKSCTMYLLLQKNKKKTCEYCLFVFNNSHEKQIHQEHCYFNKSYYNIYGDNSKSEYERFIYYNRICIYCRHISLITNNNEIAFLCTNEKYCASHEHGCINSLKIKWHRHNIYGKHYRTLINKITSIDANYIDDNKEYIIYNRSLPEEINSMIDYDKNIYLSSWKMTDAEINAQYKDTHFYPYIDNCLITINYYELFKQHFSDNCKYAVYLLYNIFLLNHANNNIPESFNIHIVDNDNICYCKKHKWINDDNPQKVILKLIDKLINYICLVARRIYHRMRQSKNYIEYKHAKPICDYVIFVLKNVNDKTKDKVVNKIIKTFIKHNKITLAYKKIFDKSNTKTSLMIFQDDISDCESVYSVAIMENN